MPRYRKLYVKVCESLDVQDMPDDFHRLLWVLLPLGLDSEGRGVDNPSWIKAKVMPLRLDVTTEMIESAMVWYANRGMVVRYQVSGRSYFWIPTFKQYQGNTSKEAESNYPAPPNERTTGSRPTLDQRMTNSITDANTDTDSDTDSDTDAETDADGAAAAVVQPASDDDYLTRGVRYYEGAIGLVAGMRQSEEIRMSLEELHERGLDDWWQTAIDIAVDANARNWRYISAILTNHLREGVAPTRKTGPIHGPPKPQKRTIRVIDPQTGQPQVVEAMV